MTRKQLENFFEEIERLWCEKSDLEDHFSETVSNLNNEVNSLRLVIQQGKQLLDANECKIRQLNTAMQDLVKVQGRMANRNIKLEEALLFYADKENWDTDHYSPTIWDNGSIDLGKKARKVLEELKNK